MKNLLPYILVLISFTLDANVAYIKPPNNWHITPKESLPEGIAFMCTLQTEGFYPPSISFGAEPFKGSLSDYLKMMKRINTRSGDRLTNLGKFAFANGCGALVQIDMGTKWGAVKLLQLIHIKERQVFVFTAAASKEDYPKQLPIFISTFKELKIGSYVRDEDVESFYDILTAHEKSVCESNLSDSEIFKSDAFQTKYWKPFAGKVSKQTREYAEFLLTYTYE